MNKSLAILMSAIAIAAAPITPVLADDGLMDATKNALMVPITAVSIGTGLVVGVPVAILRRTTNRCIEYTGAFADKIGGKDSGPAVIMASAVAFPYGIAVGTGEGIFDGGRNAIQHSVEKPFGLDSMSLGDDLEEH